MEIGDVNFDDLAWGIQEEEENLLFKKDPLIGIFTPIIGLNTEYAASTKTGSKQYSKYSFVAASRGSWGASISGEKDDQGNSKASADVKIGKQTDSGINFSAQAGGSVSSDKNQNFRGNAHGSLTIEKETESGINISVTAGGGISRDKNQNTKTSAEGSLNLKGNF